MINTSETGLELPSTATVGVTLPWKPDNSACAGKFERGASGKREIPASNWAKMLAVRRSGIVGSVTSPRWV